ncbi:MAG: hypothetical protein KBT76_10635 [Sulfitobacter litoralis]|nr:hypothetical protein [Sulfitobacter litoralis]
MSDRFNYMSRFGGCPLNMLWVSDFTYISTRKGFVNVAFVIDAYARSIVGLWARLHMLASFFSFSFQYA